MPDSDEDLAALEHYVRTRDLETRDRLVERYKGLALYHARRFADRGIEFDDLEQVAMIGLLKSLDRFDLDRKVALSTYASRTIDGELKRHFRDRGWSTHVPRGVRDLSVAVKTATDDLETQLGRPPKPAEVAERLGVDTGAVLEALDARSAYRATSLDETLSPVAGGHDRNLSAAPDRVMIDELLAELPERERAIVTLRFYDRLTQTEIAERVGISQMHVSRLLRQSLLTLREHLADRGVADVDVILGDDSPG